MELLRKGKVKDVYAVNDDELEFRYSNRISVFDKIIPTSIPKKGEVLCRTSAFWFRQAEDLGLKSHFLRLEAPDRMRVRRVRVIRDYDKLDGETTNFLIPLEVICRHYAAGSFIDRIKKGKLDPESAGLPAGEVPEYGQKLPEPFVEFTTKLEETDRPLTEAEALEMSGLSEEELEEIKRAVIDIDARMQARVADAGLIHVDGKKEFAYDEDRNLMVIDSFGTPDEDRWWDEAAYNEGRFVELSKEFVRQHYRDTGYHKRLYDARDQGIDEPDIPALPDDVTQQVTDLYVGLYERMTGREF